MDMMFELVESVEGTDRATSAAEVLLPDGRESSFIWDLIESRVLRLVARQRPDCAIEFYKRVFDVQRFSGSVDHEYLVINYGQCFRHQGMEVPEEVHARLKAIASKANRSAARMGAKLVLGENEQAIELVKEAAAKSDPYLPLDEIVMEEWPIFRLFTDEQYAELERIIKECKE